MIGGVVFMPLTINFLKVWGKKWTSEGPRELVYLALNQDKIDKDIDEIVVVDDILPNEENANYNPTYEIVTEVDGQKVTSLKQFVDLVNKSTQRYVNILFSSKARLIFDKEKAIQTDSETMKRYGITKKERL
jgi:S1-C subfamily serine protease